MRGDPLAAGAQRQIARFDHTRPAPSAPRAPPRDPARAHCPARDVEQRLHGRLVEAADLLAISLARAAAGNARPAAECLRGARAAAADESRWCSDETADPAESVRLPLLPPGRRWWPKSRARPRCCVFDDPDALDLAGFERRAAAWPAGSASTFAISSRNSVPPSASSKRPTRSILASVNAPFTWPNISLSKTPSASPPAFTVTMGLRRARGDRVQHPRDHFLAGAGLAGDQHVGIRRAHARDQLQHRLHRRRFRNHRRQIVRAQQSILRLQPLPACAAPRSSSIWVRRIARQARVFPGLLNEIARAAAHGFDRQFDAAPGRHHDHGSMGSSA